MKNINVNLGRKLSLENATPIGHGYIGDVYRIDPETVVKVLKFGGIEEAEKDIMRSKWALVNGIPTAISYDVVDVEGRPGLVYELLGKGSLRDELINHPESFDRRMCQYTKLMRDIHAVEDTDARLPKMIDQHLEKLERLPYITEDERDRMRMLLNTIPDTNHVVHCDCHFKNIKIVNDELMLIDLDTLSRGDPIFDMVSVYSSYHAFSEGHGYTEIDLFFDIPVAFEEKVLNTLFRKYFANLSEADLTDNINKIALLSYANVLSFYYWCNEKENFDLPKLLGLFREYLYKVEDLRLKY